MKKYIKLMRVHHSIKNGLIFLPLLFSGQLGNREMALKAFLGVIAFSLISSVVYIINDLKDVEHDRRHPTKCKRPIASGAVSVHSARLLAAMLFVFALIFNFFACQFHTTAWCFIALYFGCNIGYSLGLKNIPIIDIVILVSGFLLRVLYGAAITEIEISSWLYLTVISACFYMSLGKRRNELLRQGEGISRKVLQFYNHAFLDKNMYMCLALTIAFYSLWCVDPITVQRTSGRNFVWTVPLVIVICMKYSLNVERDSDGDPVEVILSDRTLLFLSSLFVAVIFGIIYL